MPAALLAALLPALAWVLALALALAPAPPVAAQPPVAEPAPQPPAEPVPPAQVESVPTAMAEPAPAAAGEPWFPDVAEPGSVEAIRRFTTAPEYLPESVAYVPDSDVVPSPTEVLGHLAGAPDELSSVATVHGYFRRLAEASGRVEVRTLGRSEEGREMLLVLISSPRNLAALPRISEINHRLTDPRVTDRATARALAEEGRVVYYLLGGLHSTETGSPEMLMELAYRLAVSERPEIRRIRDEVVVAITPIVEPDGRDRVVEWYERHLRGRDLSWQELREFGSPPYWGHYVFHDNNRDGLQRTQALTRAVQGAFDELRPQVMHDLHESLPLLYISTGHGPYSTAVDPVTINRWTWFAHDEAATLQAQGLPGVWVWGFWDGWWPGYLVSVASNHHAIGRFYETFGNSVPGTFERDLSDVKFAGQPVTDVEWYRPWPPGKTVTWSLRDNTNYMEAGVLAALELASAHRRELLTDGWAKAERSLERGRTLKPAAWVFPPEQRDPARLAYLVNQLLAHGIEVQRLTAPPPPAAPEGAAAVPPPAEQTTGTVAEGEAGEVDGAAEEPPWPVGSYVVRMDQPLRDLAMTLLEVQEFPKDEPNPPYDDVAWTWPLLYGVDGEKVDDRAVLDEPMEPVTAAAPPAGTVTGYGDGIYLLADRGQTSLLSARVALGDAQVDAAEKPFEVNGVEYPAGSWIVQAPRDEVEAVAARYGLHFEAALTMPGVRAHLLDLPSLGLVHTWTSTQDAGWVRYTLDQAGVPYALVSPDDLRAGHLAERFDVLVFPQAGGDFARLVYGIDPAWGPLAYTQTDRYPSHGIPDASPDVTGGMGLEGLLELRRFVAGGGLLVTLGNSGTVAVDGGLVRHVERKPASSVKSPGSEVAARVLRPLHPLAYGYPERTSVFRGNGPLFEVPKRLRERVVVQFGDELPKGSGTVPAAAPGAAAPLAADEAIEEEDIEAAPVPVGEAAVEAGEETAGGGEEAPAEATAEEPADASAEEEPPRDLVLSGWVAPEKALAGEPAILDVPAGRGRVILFAFDPLHRYLNLSDFRFLYNALLNWNDLP